jgi:amino acid adenylation domain-containing protein
MGNFSIHEIDLAVRQPLGSDGCALATVSFVEFKRESIESSISDRFEQQALNHRDRLAIKTNSHALTYDELNQAANRVAKTIIERRGAGQEPVALLLEKGAPLVVAILGVLKAGKIYLPLEPSLPRTRIHSILEDSQAGLIVTDSKNLSSAKVLAQDMGQTLNIDKLDSSLSTENLGLSASPDAYAYIVYTSGSTGRPKGVIENHRNVLHRIMEYTNSAHISASDRLTFLGTAVSDIFAALLNGATLYPMNLKAEGTTNLARWLIQNEITVYNSVATVFRHFINTLTGEEAFPKLRLIKLHGEPVYKRDFDLYKKHFSPDCLFVNSLGSTEAGHISHYFADKDVQIADDIVPAGYVVEDKEVLLLDDAGKAVGKNQIGEIAVKSRYLSPGYWRRPDLTQAAFLSTPESGDERVYLTGDLGRVLPNGCLIHLGRKDLQVKVRGQRIEVAEVEIALLNLNTVKGAVVVTREDTPADKRLVAYLVPAKQPAPTLTTLRRTLAGCLPDFMIPSTFVMLEALPLTPTGKVDRRALPAPDQVRSELEGKFVAPSTPLESLIAAAWQNTLSLEKVGVHDNFFDLGGDSLLSTQVAARLRTEGLHITLRDMMFLTLGQLASICKGQMQSPKRARPMRYIQNLSHVIRRTIFHRKADCR